jgi:hypothetical protein
MTTKTPNPTIELTLTSGATITSNAHSCAGTMVDELRIPLSTLASSRIVKLPTVAEVDTVTEKLGIILVEVKKLKSERDQLTARVERLSAGIMHHRRELTIGDDLSDIDLALYKLVATQEPQK